MRRLRNMRIRLPCRRGRKVTPKGDTVMEENNVKDEELDAVENENEE